jgi:hypothetical protein
MQIAEPIPDIGQRKAGMKEGRKRKIDFPFQSDGMGCGSRKIKRPQASETREFYYFTGGWGCIGPSKRERERETASMQPFGVGAV